MGNSFGKLFRITTFGESHGKAIGVILDGCPAGLAIDSSLIQQQLDRRKPGQSKITTQRKETDEFQILSGVFEGKSTGTPITLVIWNKDAKSKDYSHIADKFRPSHADFTYQEKYGIAAFSGGGRASMRRASSLPRIRAAASRGMASRKSRGATRSTGTSSSTGISGRSAPRVTSSRTGSTSTAPMKREPSTRRSLGASAMARCLR